MEKLGWIGGKRPKMISVQAEGCAPIVRAFE
jgi:threonine synthase